MVLPVEDCVACRGAGLFRYGGIGTIIFPVSSAGFANSGAITKTANAELCSTIEIPTARRLIFLSRAFSSASPSTRHPLNVPVHSSAFARSSLDITHLQIEIWRGSDLPRQLPQGFRA